MPDPTKIHPNLAERLQVRGFGPAQPLRVIVRYKAGARAVATMVEGITETYHTYRLISASAHSVEVSAIGALSDREDVEQIWLDEPVHTMLDASVPLLGVPQVWEAGFTGKGITVAVIDTGVDLDHPDFAGRVAQSKDFTGEGYFDGSGHGTHVASTIGGTGAADNGKFRGVAPECTLLAAKVLRGDGSGNMSDVMAGVEWAVQQRAQVLNLSLGGGGASDGTDALSTTCDAAVARGVVMCIAAGNSGPGASTVGSPGAAKRVITIGATSKADAIANFSSRGPTKDGRVKPDLCFPGVGIIAARAKGTSMGSPQGDFYTSASGTSMATPHAAGACALLLQAKPGLSPDQIKDILMGTAKDLSFEPNAQGKGRADIFAAYTHAAGEAPAPTPPPQQPPAQGQGCAATIGSLVQMISKLAGGR
ncbi:MAG: S8 family peptidase [Chloroflexi bacterium]|nr:S8 family peptidase [Chloroflexota bacterium]